jgi:hypothetical protein
MCINNIAEFTIKLCTAIVAIFFKERLSQIMNMSAIQWYDVIGLFSQFHRNADLQVSDE